MINSINDIPFTPYPSSKSGLMNDFAHVLKMKSTPKHKSPFFQRKSACDMNFHGTPLGCQNTHLNQVFSLIIYLSPIRYFAVLISETNRLNQQPFNDEYPGGL
jgi:hypothetical protein